MRPSSFRHKEYHFNCHCFFSSVSQNSFIKKFCTQIHEGNIGVAVEPEVKLCDDVEAVGEFTYLSDRVNAGGGCEATVTARTRCWWFKPWECDELLHGRRFHLDLKGAVHKNNVKPAIMYRIESWCQNECEMAIL